MPKPQYGARDGLADRLDEWAARLGRDRSLPWVGLGLIADLKAASDEINGVPEDEFANFQPAPKAAPQVEFDL